MDGWMDRWMDGWMDGQPDRQTDTQTDRHNRKHYLPAYAGGNESNSILEYLTAKYFSFLIMIVNLLGRIVVKMKTLKIIPSPRFWNLTLTVVMTLTVAITPCSPRLNSLCTTFSLLISQLLSGAKISLRNCKKSLHFMSNSHNPNLDKFLSTRCICGNFRKYFLYWTFHKIRF